MPQQGTLQAVVGAAALLICGVLIYENAHTPEASALRKQTAALSELARTQMVVPNTWATPGPSLAPTAAMPVPAAERSPKPSPQLSPVDSSTPGPVSLSQSRPLAPLRLPCCTCSAEALGPPGGPRARMTDCELCGQWVASPGTSSTSHISSGVVLDSATALQTKNSWLWLDGASFDSPEAPCVSRWDADAALRCVSDRRQRIMFEGDSLVRNTFLGLLLLLRGTDKLKSSGYAYPQSKVLGDAYRSDGVVGGKGGEYADRLFNGFKSDNTYTVESTPLSNSGDAWVRYYNNVYSLARLDVLKKQVELLKPHVLILGVPSIHDYIGGADPRSVAVSFITVPTLALVDPRLYAIRIQTLECQERARCFLPRSNSTAIVFTNAAVL